MPQRHIIGNTGPHKRVSLKDLNRKSGKDSRILDEYQDLYGKVLKSEAEVGRIEESDMIPFHKRVQLESAQRQIQKISQEVTTKINAVSRRQDQTKQSFPGTILNPRQSQKISPTILTEAQQEFQKKLDSLTVIENKLDEIVKKVETLLEGLPETL